MTHPLLFAIGRGLCHEARQHLEGVKDTDRLDCIRCGIAVSRS